MASGIFNSPNNTPKLPKTALSSAPWWPTLSVMDRYIILELLPPFLFGVGAFTSLGVSIGALFELIRKVSEYGLPFGTATQILLLKMPEFISYSFPMAVLLAALITYSRFSSDSELVALKGCGIQVSRVILPGILLSLVVTGIAFTFNELIVPIANAQATATLNAVVDDDQGPTFRQENILFQDYQDITQDNGKTEETLSRLFYARRFDGETMYGLTVLDFSKEQLSQIISAQSATWNPDDSRWDFFDGTIYFVLPDGSYGNILKFEQQQLQLPRTPLDIAENKRKDPNEMNLAESWEHVRELRQRGSRSRLRKLLIRIHQKYALPFACLVFGIAGAALGSRLRRTGRAISFALSIVIIFGYYLLYSICSALSHAEVLTPMVGAWIPNVVGVLIGGI